jgi:hypothetical protein
MAPEVAAVLATVRSMPRDQVADLAYELLRILDEGGHDSGVEAAWNEEFGRRLGELESGAVTPVDHETTVAMARASIADRRK